MKKIVLSLLVIFATILSSSCFANTNMINDMANGMKNIVNGSENVIQDTAQGAGNVVKDISGGINQGVNNMGNTMENMTNDNNYTGTRTAATANYTNGTFMGINSVALSWLVMAVLGAVIVGLVWFYGKQHEDGYNPDKEDNY